MTCVWSIRDHQSLFPCTRIRREARARALISFFICSGCSKKKQNKTRDSSWFATQGGRECNVTVTVFPQGSSRKTIKKNPPRPPPPPTVPSLSEHCVVVLAKRVYIYIYIMFESRRRQKNSPNKSNPFPEKIKFRNKSFTRVVIIVCCIIQRMSICFFLKDKTYTVYYDCSTTKTFSRKKRTSTISTRVRIVCVYRVRHGDQTNAITFVLFDNTICSLYVITITSMRYCILDFFIAENPIKFFCF